MLKGVRWPSKPATTPAVKFYSAPKAASAISANLLLTLLQPSRNFSQEQQVNTSLATEKAPTTTLTEALSTKEKPAARDKSVTAQPEAASVTLPGLHRSAGMEHFK
ncbi:hypothetical protein BC936DRAFT_149738 [Jimgerdemannia flammicorona]|uniref:Uncharacterized protein n=1 Tax=Jimgerdemannia flammicorona TaxID=994334 RepID=A0A433D071_9FUNG|nr:hypothetical protein BC936DRAFT_149738 [Jimgerdemannia flammicorona]